jgi:hypothetical protein
VAALTGTLPAPYLRTLQLSLSYVFLSIRLRHGRPRTCFLPSLPFPKRIVTIFSHTRKYRDLSFGFSTCLSLPLLSSHHPRLHSHSLRIRSRLPLGMVSIQRTLFLLFETWSAIAVNTQDQRLIFHTRYQSSKFVSIFSQLSSLAYLSLFIPILH